MNAIEFVNNYGIEEARSKINDCSFLGFKMFNWLGNNIVIDDLKQIVEAFELVESYGGLDESNIFVQDYSNDASDIYDLKQAINLVEQCNDR